MRLRSLVLVGSLMAALVLAACVTSPRDTARQACGVVEGHDFYVRTPPGGIYIGLGSARSMAAAIADSQVKVLRDELPAWKDAITDLTTADDGVEASRAESQIQLLVSKALGYCYSTFGGVPPT
jgi:hypothetical protein